MRSTVTSRPERPVESAVYFAVAELLANVASALFEANHQDWQPPNTHDRCRLTPSPRKEDRHAHDTSRFRIEARETGRTHGGSHVPASISSPPGTRAVPGAAQECTDFRRGAAGLTLAYWLSRHGFCPTVVERAPAPRDGGQAVDIRGAAIDVAGRAGILGALRQAHTRTRGMTYVSATGKHLASMNAAFGVVDAADVEIVRGDLVGILYEAARSGAEYIFGDSVTGMTEVPGAVEVTFERAEPRTFDLVIGADGLHSTLRALAFGPEPSFVRHLGMYLSVFTVPNDMGLDHWQLIHVSPGKSVTVTSARDNTEARAIFFFASPPLEYDHRDISQQQELLEAAFAGQGWEIPRLLAAMRDAPDFYFDSVSQIRMDNWSADRVTLVGDAATALRRCRARAPASRWSGLMCWPVHCRPPAATTASPSPLTSAGCGTSWLVTSRSRSGTPSGSSRRLAADLAAEPGHQDTALPPRQEARPRPGHQRRPGGSQRHRAGRQPGLISGPVTAAVVTARRFAKQAAGQDCPSEGSR